MDDATGAALINATSQAINTAGNMLVSGELNRRGEKFNREVMEKQRKWSLEDWHMQNAYNDPAAQMQRLKNAGLNPHLVYGNGTSTQAESVRATPNQSAPSYAKPQFSLDMINPVMAALGVQQAQANISRTNAETDAIKSRTAGTEFQNNLNNAIGIDRMQRNYDIATDRLELNYQRESADFDAWEAASFAGKPTDDKNSPLARAYRAGFDLAAQNLINARELGDLRRAESVIKGYQSDLVKQGIDPNTPWYAKMVGALLMKAFNVKSLSSLTNGF